MGHQMGRLVSEILHRYFGELVQQVGNDLFTYGSKPTGLIVKTTGLPRSQVIECLRALLKFELATFEPSTNEVTADYKLIPENVLLLLRYPKYLFLMKKTYGSEAELLVEELLQQGSLTSTVLLVTIANKYKDDKEKNITLIKLRDVFVSLATAGYIQQAPVAELKESEVPTLVPVATIVPDLDVRVLNQVMTSGNFAEANDNIYWKVNKERFHQDFRDELMVKAVTRRIDDHAGELMRLLLQQSYLSSPAHAADYSPSPISELRRRTRHLPPDSPLHTFFDHYVRVLEECGAGAVRRGEVGGEGDGGTLAVRPRRAAAALLHAALDHTVRERLGEHAARIFRLIRIKKYIEEEDIQKHAMLPNKECKELTYKLLEQHFISVQTMRKTASAGAMAKAIYLYHIKENEVAHVLRGLCWRALAGGMQAAGRERAAHARLRGKQRRVRSIVHGMRARREPDANIHDVEETLTPPELAVLQGVDKRLKQLSAAELEIDGTLFIIEWFFSYPQQ